MKTDTVVPVGAGVVDRWRDVPLNESGEPIVAIGCGTEYDDLVTSAVYAGEHLHSPYRDDNVIDAAHPTIYVRRSVAERLQQAQRRLPDEMRLIVFDGYRSVQVQRALYDQFMNELRVIKPDWDLRQLREETERYVALPSTDAACPSPHLTGGAVDVAIIRDGRMIEFGTPFDHGSARSALRYFEDDTHVRSEADLAARDHRRLLYYVMHEAGFEGFEHEWWHYNAPETQMGARSACRQRAVFGNGTPLLPTKQDGVARRATEAGELFAPIDRIAPSN